jgi:hypothetical protein
VVVSCRQIDESLIWKCGPWDELVSQAYRKTKRPLVGLSDDWRLDNAELKDRKKTHAERAPYAKLTIGSDGSGNAIACSNLEGAKTIIDKSLKRVWECGQQFGIQEATRDIRVRDIFGSASKSGIIIYTTGPDLGRLVSFC